ncbi:hypothetical protein EBU02_10870 [bacterium]|nr:hypothetical protein [bacterium]
MSQAGNTNYNAATSVTQVLSVALPAPVVAAATINGTVGQPLSVSINATKDIRVLISKVSSIHSIEDLYQKQLAFVF